MSKVNLVVACFAACTLSICGGAVTRAAPESTVDRAGGDVRLAGVFAENMVLQRDRPIRFWGEAPPGQVVNVWLGQNSARAVADGSGKWSLTLGPFAAGGPHQITVSGRETYKIDNILIGDVWLCAGQSNMQWTVAQSIANEKDLGQEEHPCIRLLQVRRETASSPLESIDPTWVSSTAQAARKFSAVSYYYGHAIYEELQIPIGLIDSSWGGTPIEPWMPNDRRLESSATQPSQAPARPARPGEIYNAMVAPLTSLPIRGIIWYQGEANVRRAETYGILFKSMILSWRRAWGDDDLPFGFVQIAPYEYRNLADWHGTPQSLPRLREGQAEAARDLKNVGMVVVTDIADVTDIHSVNKRETARRLALWAMATTYGKSDIKYIGPTFEDMAIEGDRIRIRFQHTDRGMLASDSKPLSGFQISGDDRQFVKAEANIEGDCIVVHSSSVKRPVAVRFCYEDVAQPNLFNGLGFPAAPFRTDDWPVRTGSEE